MKTYEVYTKTGGSYHYDEIKADEIDYRSNGLVLFKLKDEVVFYTTVYNLISAKPKR